mmetsp:Transcript_50475/g.132965  ORF Transcript_50475/g.132965 Transcript_50475/m.132965 type:complete len:201 (-) Transcript_50475:719-1321(-)
MASRHAGIFPPLLHIVVLRVRFRLRTASTVTNLHRGCDQCLGPGDLGVLATNGLDTLGECHGRNRQLLRLSLGREQTGLRRLLGSRLALHLAPPLLQPQTGHQPRLMVRHRSNHFVTLVGSNPLLLFELLCQRWVVREIEEPVASRGFGWVPLAHTRLHGLTLWPVDQVLVRGPACLDSHKCHHHPPLRIALAEHLLCGV